jgi:trigger factor
VVADVKNIANLREYEGDNRMFSLDNPSIHQEFRDGLAGMKVGEEKEIRWTRTHTRDDETHEVDFAATVKVNALRQRVVPEITEENVKSDYGFDTVDELIQAVREEIEAQKKAELPQLKEDLIVEEIGKRVDMDIPDTFIEQVYRENINQLAAQLQAQGISLNQYLSMQGINPRDYMNDVREQSIDRAAQALALDAFARHLELDATEEEIADEFSHSGVEDWEVQLEEFRAAGRMPAVREAIRRRKALEWLVDHVDVTVVDADEWAALMAADEEESDAEVEAEAKTEE